MKKSVLIKLIGSLILVTVAGLACILTLMLTGVLKEERPELVISSASAMAVYDGEALTDTSWHLLEGELQEGHRLSCTVRGTQTNVGISENYVSAKVTDAAGNDVSGDYTITYRPGALNVKPREITITAVSSMQRYNGIPLTDSRYELDSLASLLTGHTLSVDITGTQTAVGRSANKVTSVTITDRRGADVTGNYSIKTTDGELIVYSPEAIVIQSESDSKTYDGTPLTNSDWKLISGTVPGGHLLDVKVSGTQTEAGSCENTITAKMYDQAGRDISDDYEIICTPGRLTVLKQYLTVTTHSASKVYDGTPLTEHTYTVSPIHVISAGNLVLVEVSGSQTRVGSSENRVNTAAGFRVINADNQDVSNNYAILEYEYGTLTVTEPEEERETLRIRSATAEKEYDGTALTRHDWFLEEGTLREGHALDVRVQGTITESGEVDNFFTVAVVDSAENDVTSCYDIIPTYGILRVLPVEVTVTASSDEKVYDGLPLTNEGFTLSKAYLKDSFTFIPSILGSITEVGSTQNLVTACTVENAGGKDVTDNFIITKESGTLTVLPPEEEKREVLVYTTGSSKKYYDGTPLFDSTWERTEGTLATGHTELVSLNTELTLPSKADNAPVIKIVDEHGEDVTDRYTIRIEPGTLEVEKRPITVKTRSSERPYNGEALTNPEYTVVSGINTTEVPLVSGHTATVINSGSITLPGSVSNTIGSCVILNGHGEDVSAYYEIVPALGILTVTDPMLSYESESDVKYYDGAALSNPTWVRTAGLLLPGDREVVSVDSTITEPGETENTITVTILNEYDEDVSDCYILDLSPGTLTVNRRPIVLRAGSGQKFYDGTPLEKPEVTHEAATPDLLDPLLPEHSIDATVSGSITEPGAIQNTIEGYLITDEHGQDVSRFYQVSKEAGVLAVDRRPIKLITGSDRKYYDGTPLEKIAVTYEATSDELLSPLLSTHSIGAIGSGSITEPGTVKNALSGDLIVDEHGQDVSRFYVIATEEGELTVVPRVITLTSAGGERYYNGEAYADSTVTYTPASTELPDPLLPTHRIAATAEGSITEPGTVINTITGPYIVDENGDDVSHLYVINKEEQSLTVRRRPITIVAESASKVYDGEALEKDAAFFRATTTALPDPLLPTHQIAATAEGSITDPGQCSNLISEYAILDADAHDVSEFYVISTAPGTLTVNLRSLTIVSKSDTKTYDGTPLTNDGYTLFPNDSALLAGHGLTVTVTGTITEIGNTPNTIESYTITDATGQDASRFYTVTKNEGTLTVTEAPGSGDGPGDGDDDGEGEDPGAGGGSTGPDVGGSMTGDGSQGEPMLICKVTSGVKGSFLLKSNSFGNYDHTQKTWLSAPSYSGPRTHFFLPGNAIFSNDFAALSSMTITPSAGLAIFPYYMSAEYGSGTITMPFVNIPSESRLSYAADAPYTVDFYPLEGTTTRVVGSAFKATEEEYREYAYENYLDVDDETRAFMQAIIDKKKFVAYEDSGEQRPSVFSAVRDYIKNAAFYSLDYPQELDEEENIITAFLGKYQTGVCRHFASAAVMLFRTLGVPARFTTGYALSAVAGTEVDVMSDQAHAWVEVYDDGFGWLAIDVTGSSTQFKEDVTPTATEGLYSENVVSGLAAKQTVAGLSTLTDRGYTYTAIVDGIATELGKTPSTIVYLELRGPDGTPVYRYDAANPSNNIESGIYKPNLKPGTIHLYHSELTFQSESATYLYDGTEHLLKAEDIGLISGQLEEGYTYTLTPKGTISNVGTAGADYAVTIYYNGDVVANDHYKIHATTGKLTVTPRSITLQAASAEQLYDGSVLTAHSCTVVAGEGDGLADSDWIESCVTTGKQQKPGNCDNVIQSVIIKNANGDDVTTNYNITTRKGQLVVIYP